MRGCFTAPLYTASLRQVFFNDAGIRSATGIRQSRHSLVRKPPMGLPNRQLLPHREGRMGPQSRGWTRARMSTSLEATMMMVSSPCLGFRSRPSSFCGGWVCLVSNVKLLWDRAFSSWALAWCLSWVGMRDQVSTTLGLTRFDIPCKGASTSIFKECMAQMSCGCGVAGVC